MLRVDAVRVVAILLLQSGLIATVSGAFDYYATYPGYDDYCIGGELENETFIFDGKDSYVSIGLPVPDLTEFTFCWWMRSIANDSEATIVSYFAPGNDSILVKNVSNLVLSIGSEDGPQSGVETNYGLWHHVCVLWTSEGGEYKIYKDGWELFKEEGLAVNKTIYGGGDITLGNDGDLFYEGELTQFNMWNYTLTEDEIRALSEDSLNRGCGNVVFWSALTSSDLSCIETKETELPKHQDHRFACLEDEISPRVVDFDGVSSYLTVSVPIPELSQFTICFWIKAKVTYTSDWQTIFSYFVEGDTVGSIALQKLDDLELVVRNEEGKSSDESVSDGQWHHVCVMWNSKNGHHTYVVDGDSKVGRKLAKGLHVHGGGTLVLGQMQTGLNETFAEEHALSAVVSHFNVWTIKLLQSEMKAMFFYPCNRTCGNLVWWPHIIAMESTTALIRAPEGESDLFSCDRTDPCDPGVFDDKLWEIDNTGDWSLAPMPKRIPHLKAFTICFWMRLDDDFANQTNTAFSYFVPGDTEGSIVLENVNNLVVIVNNERSEPTGVNLNNQTSHFICLIWKSRTGTYTIYDKSTVLYEGHGLAVDTMVPGGGSLIIGQRQSNISTGFNKMDSYYGKLRYFNFFSKALKKREVKLATKACDPACGDVISWHELRYVDLINIRVRKLTCGGGGLTTVATTFPMSTIGTTQTEVYTEQPTTESFETFAPVTSVPPKTWSTLPGPLSTLPSTISTPPEVPSTLRSTVSTTPEAPSTLPSTISTPPEVPSTLPSTMSTTPQAPSTLRSTVSTPPEVPSTLLSTISTPPEVPSTLPSTMSTPPEVPSTVRSTVSTPPEVPSTLPSTMPTPPEVPSTLRSYINTSFHNADTFRSSIDPFFHNFDTSRSGIDTFYNYVNAHRKTDDTIYTNVDTARNTVNIS
ncbi:uncharacterized protein [Ptychodera flava]|uniref:uncharacterized protein n=1 Tax=Ptychodera flava TaxID=63121 RepID=UPI00396A5C45